MIVALTGFMMCGKSTYGRVAAEALCVPFSDLDDHIIEGFTPGEIIREMALGKGALDLGVLFRGAKYAVEVKLRYLWDKSPDKALEQVRCYTDHLGVGEGWLVVFDPDMAKPWDEKIAHEDRTVDGKPIHVFYC